jgi:hypothetical protein
MSKTGGGSWVCLALLGLVACSSPAAPPAEGSAQVTWTNGCSLSPDSINGPGGIPSGMKVGANQTVLDGRDGYKVSCSVVQSGSKYSVSASIEKPDEMTLTLDSSSISATGGPASMSFFSPGSINTWTSPTGGCTITTTSTTEGLTVKPGSIWATYICPQVSDVNNLGKTCQTSGFVVFTGCSH